MSSILIPEKATVKLPFVANIVSWLQVILVCQSSFFAVLHLWALITTFHKVDPSWRDCSQQCWTITGTNAHCTGQGPLQLWMQPTGMKSTAHFNNTVDKYVVSTLILFNHFFACFDGMSVFEEWYVLLGAKFYQMWEGIEQNWSSLTLWCAGKFLACNGVSVKKESSILRWMGFKWSGNFRGTGCGRQLSETSGTVQVHNSSK